jgi:hypothetical protein
MQQIMRLKLVFWEKRLDFRKHETSFRISASPFVVDVEVVPEKFQMEPIELQSREKIK